MDFDLFSLGIGLFVGCIVGIIGSFFIREAWVERKLSRLQEENDALHEEIRNFQMERRGIKGNLAKADKAERMQSLMLEVAQAMQAPNANIQDILKGLALKYPDIAMDLVKKGMKL